MYRVLCPVFDAAWQRWCGAVNDADAANAENAFRVAGDGLDDDRKWAVACDDYDVSVAVAAPDSCNY